MMLTGRGYRLSGSAALSISTKSRRFNCFFVSVRKIWLVEKAPLVWPGFVRFV